MTANSVNISNPIDNLHQFSWTYHQQSFRLTYETFGQGNPLLLLPAFSTVSSRSELTQIARSLSSQYEVTVLDWLGFGDSERPNLDYTPSLYQQLLTNFVSNCWQQPIILVAAGHASGYALKLAQSHPHLISKIVLIAPTWCGPLRVMGMPSNIRKALKNLVRLPLIGQFLYYLNTTPSFLRFMYRRHVYIDSGKLTADFIRQKHQITQRQGSRFAPVAFVTGEIDPLETRTEVLSLVASLSQPILTIIPQQSPPYSQAEMEAIAQLPKITPVRLYGTLGISEEFGNEVAQEIKNFLS